jgi:hypothetical protein
MDGTAVDMIKGQGRAESRGIDLIRIEPMGLDLHSSSRSNFVRSAKVNLV